MANHEFMVFGLQGSGKTTFAAALWHLVDSREVPTGLVKGAHTGDYRYLEQIAQLWSEGWTVERTKSDEIESAQVNLRNPQDRSDLVLDFTDLAGEHFEKAFATRFCTPELIPIVDAADGMILFVSAKRTIDDVTILDAFGDLTEEDDAPETQSGNATADSAGVASDSAEQPPVKGPAPAEEPEAPWDPAKTPLQVQLVDLLQAFQAPPFSKPLLKVAVVISAWDIAGSTDPEEWFSKRFPLLDQYLRGKSGASGLRIYGVSAQGGELSRKGDPATQDRDKVLSIVPASMRITIAGPDVAPHDLTRPVMWLSGLEQ
jgi:hypothetical protein